MQTSMIMKSLRDKTHVINMVISPTPRSSVVIAITIVTLMILGPIAPNISQQTVWAQVGPTQSEDEYVSSSQRGAIQETERSNAVASEPDYSSNSVSQRLDYAHFVPLTNSPGNQVKLLLNYSSVDPSMTNAPINAVMEVYAANETLLRTTSFPQPLLLNQSGEIQLATTFEDEALNNITARTMLTDEEKVIPISNTLETSLALGHNISNTGENNTGTN
ncbi:MAG TPA: hypothetical protein VE504_01035 [Nitrososphaeraceae archaeon]|nr:hypothetical protein [Nitrososphaeraceae archaeon]